MSKPLHIRLRKKSRSILQTILSFFVNNNTTENIIPKDEIKTIVIIRPNYRIGNLIFLTPFINEIYKHMPDVKIDIIVGMKLAGAILQPLPNVERVIDIPRKLLLHPIELYKFIKDTRAKRYDLAINISEGSTSSQLVTTLIHAKYKASYYSKNNWAPLTHSVHQEKNYAHSALEPLELLKLFEIKPAPSSLYLDIKLTSQELASAKDSLETLLLTHNKKSLDTKIIALFRNARFDKKISDEWWNEWHKNLLKHNKNILIIDILSPDILTKLNNDVLEYSNKNLRLLGAFFKHCDMYVSADTGPMHLASASGAKTLAYFNKTSIQRFGTLGKNDKTIDINNLSLEKVTQLTLEHLSQE